MFKTIRISWAGDNTSGCGSLRVQPEMTICPIVSRTKEATTATSRASVYFYSEQD